MSDKVSTTGWTETVYLKNGVDNLPDKTTNAGETDGDYIVSGKSWMKKGAQSEMVHYYKAEPDVEEKGKLQHRSCLWSAFSRDKPVRRLSLGNVPDRR